MDIILGPLILAPLRSSISSSRCGGEKAVIPSSPGPVRADKTNDDNADSCNV